MCTASEHTILHKGCIPEKVCKTCDSSFKGTSISQLYCSKVCSGAHQVKDKSLSKKLLDELIPKHSWTYLGKLFGYSDVGIKKRAKALGCTIPIRKSRV